MYSSGSSYCGCANNMVKVKSIHAVLMLAGIQLGYASDITNVAIQQQLVDIANQEAQIAHIGANKAMMLYGVANPLVIISRWNSIANKPPLTNVQIEQINTLEIQKHNLLQQVTN